MQFAVPPRVSLEEPHKNVVQAVTRNVGKVVGKQLTELGVSIQSSKNKKDADAGVKVITQRDYQTIVSLRLAGRSNKEIAKKFGKPLEKIRGHIERAMAEFRKGRIKPEAGGVASEARDKGKDKSLQFVEDFQNGLEKSQLLPVLGDGPKNFGGDAVVRGSNLSVSGVEAPVSVGSTVGQVGGSFEPAGESIDFSSGSIETASSQSTVGDVTTGANLIAVA